LTRERRRASRADRARDRAKVTVFRREGDEANRRRESRIDTPRRATRARARANEDARGRTTANGMSTTATRRRLSWRDALDETRTYDDDDDDGDGANDGRARRGGVADEENATARRAKGQKTSASPRRALAAVDANARTTSPTTRCNTFLAGSTPGAMSAKHASRVRAVVDVDEPEEEAEVAEISFDFEDESAMMSPASVDDAELESDSTGDVTVVMSSKRGRLSRVNETFNVFKSLAQLAISPSELDVSKRRAPTPMNTPATTLTFDDDLDSPVVQARTEADLRDTVEKIANSLVSVEDVTPSYTTRAHAHRVVKALGAAIFMLAVSARLYFAWNVAIAASRPRYAIDGTAFAYRWFWRSRTNWNVPFAFAGYASYGEFMIQRALDVELRRATTRAAAFRAAVSSTRRVAVILAYVSGVLGILGVVAKASEDPHPGETTTKRGATSPFVFVPKVMMMMTTTTPTDPGRRRRPSFGASALLDDLKDLAPTSGLETGDAEGRGEGLDAFAVLRV